MKQHLFTRGLSAFGSLALGVLFFCGLVFAAQHPAQATTQATADVGIFKTDGQTVVSRTQQIVYTVVVTNAGPDAVNGVQFTDTFPAGFQQTGLGYQYVNAVITPVIVLGSYAGAVADLLPNGVMTMIVTGTVRTTASGYLTNAVALVFPNGFSDVNPANNTAVDTDEIFVQPFSPFVDVSISKTNDVTEVVGAGQTVYTLTIKNNSTQPITQALFTDFVPSNLLVNAMRVLGYNASPGNYTLRVNQPITFFANFSPEGYLVVILTSTVKNDGATMLTNTATISLSNLYTDTTLSNNTATDADPVRPTDTTGKTDVRVSKSDDVTRVVRGQPITYTIEISNVGTLAARVHMTDVFPAGFNPTMANATLQDAVSISVAFTQSNRLLVGIFDVQPGGIVRVFVPGSVSTSAVGNADGNFINTVRVNTSDIADFDESNNMATDVDGLATRPYAYLPVIRK